MSFNTSNINRLIVDFPSRNDNSRTSKVVHFASHCDGQLIPYPSSQERRKRWYSDVQMKQFKRDMIRDAVLGSHIMSDVCKSKDDHQQEDMQPSKDFLFHFIGLEHLLSSNVEQRFRAIRNSRKRHAMIVLKEYWSQVESNTISAENLALVSEESSLPARKKAHRRAVVADSLS